MVSPVNQNSYARIINNPSISGTTGHGVNINQASGADIHDNMIHDSGNRGINLVRIGAADVTGNTIDNNADNGIGVFRGSHLELDDGFNGGAANIIQNNGDFGIGCGSNSSIGTDEVFQVFAGNVGGPSSIGGKLHGIEQYRRPEPLIGPLCEKLRLTRCGNGGPSGPPFSFVAYTGWMAEFTRPAASYRRFYDRSSTFAHPG